MRTAFEATASQRALDKYTIPPVQCKKTKKNRPIYLLYSLERNFSIWLRQAAKGTRKPSAPWTVNKMFKKKKSGGDPAPMQELTLMKGSNVLLGGGGGDEESPAKRPLTELEKVQREKDLLESELKALRRLVDEKALSYVKKTEADNLVSNNTQRNIQEPPT
jgi:hypothetical protein